MSIYIHTHTHTHTHIDDLVYWMIYPCSKTAIKARRVYNEIPSGSIYIYI